MTFSKCQSECHLDNMYDFSSFPDKADENNNLQSILDEASSLPEGSWARIKLSEGVYSGSFFFDGNRVFPGKKGVSIVLEGAGEEKTVITGNFSAVGKLEDVMKRDFLKSYTAYFSGPFVEICHLAIENKAETDDMQGIALYAAAERMNCHNVKILGHKNTLVLAPLPPLENAKDEFCNSEKTVTKKPTLQLYENCTVSGTEDFVIGGAAALFRDSKFVVRTNRGKSSSCFVASPSSEIQLDSSDCSSGFFFKNCDFCVKGYDEKSFCVEPSVYVARPLRPYGKCFLFGCRVGVGFSPKLWHVRDSAEERSTAGFYVCDCSSVMLQNIEEWGKKLSDDKKQDLLSKIEAVIG